MGARYYTSVPGSRDLATRGADAGDLPAELEQLEPGELRRVAYEGEALGAVLVRSEQVPVLFEVYDALALHQTALEQCVYGHLYRLAYGDGRNFCRVRLRDLMARTQMSERRLNKVLAELVGKGHVRPMHRTRAGTLYRVYLPSEIFEQRLNESVLPGRLRPAAAQTPKGAAAAPHAGATAQPRAETPGMEPRSLAGMARACASALGHAGDDVHEAIVAEAVALLERGLSREQLRHVLAWCGRTLPRRAAPAEIGRRADEALGYTHDTPSRTA